MKRLLLGLAVALGGLLVVALMALPLLADAYRLPSQNMEPTLELGSRVLVRPGRGDPQVGDIVAVRPPESATGSGDMCAAEPADGAMCAATGRGDAGVVFLKRVVARGGDRIAMRGGRIVRNGRPEPAGPRSCTGDDCDFPREITVPEGSLFLLGDNRGASADSRFWGPVREDAVIGRYWFKYWGG